MSRTNKKIKDKFGYFQELVKESKTIADKTIQLLPKKSNAFWLLGMSDVKHKTILENIVFFVERSKRESKYGIKLSCANLCEEPFIRFDSDGPAHRNNLPGIPLEDQLITTPHFNSFQIDGKAIAYKNETLKNQKDADAISNDINFGISLFCMETNSKSIDGNFPEAVDQEREIEFPEKPKVNFDSINFD